MQVTEVVTHKRRIARFRVAGILVFMVTILANACIPPEPPKPKIVNDSIVVPKPDPATMGFPVMPPGFLDYARSLIGVPYKYASTDPAIGFDCSGFISHVFSHFKISVPRSSVDFTNYGLEVPLEEALPGDLILFTGTDSSIRIVGHMGIVEQTHDGKLWFIHSTSGKAYGVTITELNTYYMGRFEKIIRVFSM